MRVGRYGVGIKFKKQDLWVGAYWEENTIWVCLVPMLPIRISRIPKVVRF